MVDKSLSALPKFITEGLFGNLMKSTPPTASGNVQFATGISRGFDLFVVSVRRSRNKYEEQQTVSRELQLIQSNISQPDVSKVQIRDYLCRMIFCHTLNYDVSFGLIHALKLAQMGTLLDNRFGYLACTLLLHRDHELSLLIVSNIQSDLNSSNILRNMMALSTASQLLPVHTIPYVLPTVIEKLRHSRELVRQKAVLCLHQFQLIVPDLLEHSHDILQKTLFDKDPGVMATAVHIIQFYTERDAENCLRFGDILLSILRQITSRKMTSMFEYHNVPFPWLQIQILKCLTKLALKHESLLEKCIPVLKEMLQRTSFKENIAFCILYECIQSIVTIQSPKYLLDEAAEHIGKFLQSSSPNLKYIGVKLLVMLVKVNPQYSVNYQQLIVKSLENPDDNIQRKMHRLLYEIANESNIKVVCTKLLNQLKTSTDKYWRSEVISMIISLIQRFQTDNHWQVDTLFDVLVNGDDVISDKLVNKIFSFFENRYLAGEADVAHQKILVTKCVGVLVNRKSPSNTIHVALWTVGELCPLLKSMPDDKIISLVTQHLMNITQTYRVHSCAVTTLQQFVYKGIVEPVAIATKLKECLEVELPIVLRQRLSVIMAVCERSISLHYHDNDSMDLTLTFLDELVVKDLKNGSMPFVPVHLRGNKQERVTAAAAMVTDTPTVSQEEPSSGRPRTESSTSSTKTTEDVELGLNIPVAKRVWGKQGRLSTSAHKQDEAVVTKPKISEEDTKEKELATALFGGFLDRESEPDENQALSSTSTDSAGWRHLHSEKVQTDSKTGLLFDTSDEVNNTLNNQSEERTTILSGDVSNNDLKADDMNGSINDISKDFTNLFTDDNEQKVDNIAATTSVESRSDLDSALSNIMNINEATFGAAPMQPTSQQAFISDSFNADNSDKHLLDDNSTLEMNNFGAHYFNMSLEPPDVPESLYSVCDGDLQELNMDDSLYTQTTELNDEDLPVHNISWDSLYTTDEHS